MPPTFLFLKLSIFIYLKKIFFFFTIAQPLREDTCSTRYSPNSRLSRRDAPKTCESNFGVKRVFSSNLNWNAKPLLVGLMNDEKNNQVLVCTRWWNQKILLVFSSKSDEKTLQKRAGRAWSEKYASFARREEIRRLSHEVFNPPLAAKFEFHWPLAAHARVFWRKLLPFAAAHQRIVRACISGKPWYRRPATHEAKRDFLCLYKTKVNEIKNAIILPTQKFIFEKKEVIFFYELKRRLNAFCVVFFSYRFFFLNKYLK